MGHASAQQRKRVSADSDGEKMHLVNIANEVSERRDICRASDEAPHVPITGTSAVLMFTEKLQVDSLFLGGLIALRAMDVFSKYPHPRSGAPEKSSGSLGCVLRIADWRFWAARVYSDG